MIIQQSLANALTKAREDGLISMPHFPHIPRACPMHIAVSSVQLLPGCVPPQGAKNRIGAGTGRDQDSAGLRAMCEAVERYALQYRTGLGPKRSVWSSDATLLELSARELCIGAPEGSARSVGCAAGATLEDAAERGAFEHLEYLIFEHAAFAAAPRVVVDGSRLGHLQDLVQFLDDQLRQVHFECVVDPDGFVAVRAALTDVNGARPTFGGAAAVTLEEATRKAADEAVLSWRNMVELERNGAPARGQGALMDAYRGLVDPVTFGEVSSGALPADPPEAREPMPVVLARKLGRPVHVFDMTAPEIAFPVARVHIG